MIVRGTSWTRWPYLCAAAFGLAAAPSAAHAACVLSIEPAQDELLIRHNVLEPGAAYGTIELNIVNRGDSECIGQLGASLRGEQYGFRSGSSAPSILYQLVDEKSRSDITPRTGRNLDRAGGRMLHLAPGERSLEVISVTALPDEATSQGRYVQSLDLTVTDASGMSLAAAPLTLGLDIVSAALIGVKGEVSRVRGGLSVDLGELEPGERKLPVTLYVVSTGAYRVSVSSLNLGRLKHVGSQWYVSYRMWLGGQNLDLSALDGFDVTSDRWHFDDYPVRIEIGETEGKRAGNYSDRVMLTVAAL